MTSSFQEIIKLNFQISNIFQEKTISIFNNTSKKWYNYEKNKAKTIEHIINIWLIFYIKSFLQNVKLIIMFFRFYCIKST